MVTIMREFIIIVALCVYSLSSLAEPTSEAIRDEITDNISTEYVECGAYFSVVFGAFEKSGNKEATEKYKSASDQAMMFALISSQESRSKEMATKVTLARYQIIMKDMQKTIENNYSYPLWNIQVVHPSLTAGTGLEPVETKRPK